MIFKHDFIRDENDQQLFPDLSVDFACLCRRSTTAEVIGKSIPFHHHPAIEINYVVKGRLTLRTSEGEFDARQGEAIFVNTDILHSSLWYDGGEVLSLVFDSVFLSGMYGSVYERKYIQPVTNCGGFQGYLLRPDSEARIEMCLLLAQIIRLFREEPFGYEFEVRSKLCRFWCLLLWDTEALRAKMRDTDRSGSRMKPMLKYIQANYGRRILLEEIARAGAVSKRECTRCFQRYAHLSPMEYLCYYRVRMAAHYLLDTRMSISEIAEACGFGSGSYFARVFQREMGCVPREYREAGNPPA